MKNVINARKSLTFRITSNDVTKAAQNDPYNCAAACALKRKRDIDSVAVYRTRTYVNFKKGNVVRYATPKNLMLQTIGFDRSKAFDPGYYTLIPVSPSAINKLGKQQGSDQTKRKKIPAYKRKRHILKNVRPVAKRMAFAVIQ